MKKLTISIVLAASVFGLAACGSGDTETIATTNVGDITKEEYYEALKTTDPEGAVLQSLVIDQVLGESYEVTEEEIDSKIDEFKEEQGDNFDMWLMQIGVSDVEDDAFREQIKQVVLYEKVQYEDIDVTEEEIKDKFEELKENNAIEIKASHILVEDEDKAKEIKQQLDDGADFAELAEEHSMDEASAINGGDIGYFTLEDNLVEEFKEAAYNLELNEISEPVKSEFGYHIITVTDIPTFEDKKESVRKAAMQDKVNPEEVQEKINDLLKDADIDIKLEGYENLFYFEDPEEENDENIEIDVEDNEDESVKENESTNNVENETEENTDENTEEDTNENK